MSETARRSAGGAIDWDHARRFLREALLRMPYRKDPDLVEDLVQEALVRLLRFTRGGLPIRNLDALMNTLAKRTLVDYLRHKGVRESVMADCEGEIPDTPDPGPRPDESGDRLALIEFLVVEHFTATSAPCLELARHFFDSLDWNEVARLLGRAPTAVRKQWSRCVEGLRAAARTEGSALWVFEQDVLEA
jgi:DNA-directed RNA polymerase specialized sigma24 family protein